MTDIYSGPWARYAGTRTWLMKSEPDVFSIDDLKKSGTTTWEGVRNFTARNFMRDGMKLGDLVLYYHSNSEPSGVAGVAKVSRLAYPDPTQFQKKSEYFDPGAKKDDPRWLMVEVAFVEKFAEVVSLETLKNDAALKGMLVIAKGQRLSVQPVEAHHFARVLALASEPSPSGRGLGEGPSKRGKRPPAP
jgi:predicted RNA-binding protein with PUA-like domain